MVEKKKLSTTYKLMCALGFHYSEEKYGQVSLWEVLKQAFGNMYRKHLQKMMDWSIIEPFAPRNLRAKILRRIGCNVGKNVFIGDFVRVDLHYASMITIDDYAHIAAGCRLLCHKRDLSDYKVGDNYADLGYIVKGIHLGKGSLLGQQCMVMPGVTIGEGAIVGAGSLVVKDIPAWTIAIGSPAKVVKEIPKRETNG